MTRPLARRAVLALALFAAAGSAFRAVSHAEDADKQTILGPGMYVFQTRVRNSTCGDADPDGYVTTYLATIDGVPGSVKMAMELVNTAHYKNWQLAVTGNTSVVGDARLGDKADAPDSHFEVSWDKNKFKGTGFRSYNGKVDGKPQRCRVNYDALLRRLDGG